MPNRTRKLYRGGSQKELARLQKLAKDLKHELNGFERDLHTCEKEREKLQKNGVKLQKELDKVISNTMTPSRLRIRIPPGYYRNNNSFTPRSVTPRSIKSRSVTPRSVKGHMSSY